MDVASVIGLAAVGGSVGCLLRVLVRDACAAAGIRKWQAIALINVLGSAAAGVIAARQVSEPLLAMLLVGLFGGFTSFSAMVLDIVALWIVKQRASAVLLGLTTTVAAPFAAAGAGAAATAAAPLIAARGGWQRMAALDALMIIAGGSVGCAARAAVVLAFEYALLPAWSATTCCNVVGSACAAGAARALISQTTSGKPLMHAALRAHLDRLILLGLCGGLTTVSSLAVEMAELARESLWHAAALGALNVGAGCVAAASVWWLVRRAFPLRERFDKEIEAAVP